MSFYYLFQYEECLELPLSVDTIEAVLLCLELLVVTVTVIVLLIFVADYYVTGNRAEFTRTEQGEKPKKGITKF